MEPQTLEVTIEFKVQHVPGDDEHLEQILQNYFRAKGVDYEDGRIVI